MPTVYSTVFQSFIRQGFSKSFTHGYAQSVVAATHPHVLNPQNRPRPSFALRNSIRIGRLHKLGLQNGSLTSTQLPGSTVEPRHERSCSHGGLDAYFDNLRSKQAADEVEEGEHEWVQYEFPKRIGWEPSPASILLGGEPRTHNAESQELAQDGDAPLVPPEAEAALAHIDAAIQQEINARQRLAAADEPADEKSSQNLSTSALADESHSRSATPIGSDHAAASVANVQSRTYGVHLTKLTQDARYAEIPAVFEAMLVAGVKPTATAYNALLMAAIHLPSTKTEMISKALDVYADMVRRGVLPDGAIHNTAVGFFAAQSLKDSALRKSLEEKRLRYGGMDEPGKFMFESHEVDYAVHSEDDCLDYALTLFNMSVNSGTATYTSETYHRIISACVEAGRLTDVLQLFGHMETNRVTPFAATFPVMISAYASSGDLISAMECYDEYQNLAIANNRGEPTLKNRLDAQVYAAVIHAYLVTDKPDGAMKFYNKIVQAYGVQAAPIQDTLIHAGFVKGLVERGIYEEALGWAQKIESKSRAMSEIATTAADNGDKQTAVAAFANVSGPGDMVSPAIALLAMSVREGDVATASRYWHILNHPDVEPTAAFIDPTAMFAVAMIGSGQVAEGLSQSEMMLQRIAGSDGQRNDDLAGQVQEAVEFISRFMSDRGISDPRELASQASADHRSFTASPFPSTTTATSYDETFDPHAHNTDFKGSALIADELEATHGRKGPRMNDALARFHNMRRAGRHPRYITYARLISAAARDNKMELCQNILAMARTDVPLLAEYPVVCYGWSSILDAMVGACLSLGNRGMAEQYHQELLAMGATPSANTFGLYITTLKESGTFDEATEAVRIFHRAKAEGVEPSSFLYNALIGKLGKARRIDDVLLYFSEMRARGIKPTSVTYGTIVNALCRVSDETFAENLFDEMEAMPNYKARPAPYNSMMQFFLTTKRDKSKVLSYYERMTARGIHPTAHTYKLLVDAHATLEPVNMTAAEAILDRIRASGQQPEPVHYASLIHARGCVQHDMEGARRIFDSVMKDPTVTPNACLFQALFEAMVANHQVADTWPVLSQMRSKRVQLTPYIANTLIHGWAAEKDIAKAKGIYASVSRDKREPSTYEAMTRAFLAVEDREGANGVVTEMLSRGYPSAVANKVLELLSGGKAEEATAAVVA